mmetsp:Transcript_53404/g.169818  ORF Transcript_53404/g.169818 Transcript_53404/m.169818 type:complete len:240 (+) Transcript_53404:1053-1772(+)
MAKCTPFSSAPSVPWSPLGLVAPVASTTASLAASISAAEWVTPMLASVTKVMPSAAMRSTRRCTMSILSVFMLGTPYIMSPPMRSARSYTVTEWPILLSWSAAARPAGPEPTIATFLPVRTAGGRGTIQPFSKPLSMIVHSIDLIVTAGSMMPSTHEPSHGAGHTRPVNSGKLLVSSRRSRARRHSPLCTRSFHSGILFPRGQPESFWWQKGVPQFMHRAAWVWRRSPVASASGPRQLA